LLLNNYFFGCSGLIEIIGAMNKIDPTKSIPVDREDITNLSLCEGLVPGEVVAALRENINSYRLRVWDKLFCRDNLGFKKITPWGAWTPYKKGMLGLEGTLNNVWLDSELSSPFLDEEKQKAVKKEMAMGGGVKLQDSLFARMQVRSMSRDLLSHNGDDVPKEILDLIPLFLPPEGITVKDKWVFLDSPTLATLSWDHLDESMEKIWLMWSLRACVAGFPASVASRESVLSPERLLSPVSARFDPIQAVISACWALGAADDYRIVMALDHPVKKKRGAYIMVSFLGEGRNRLIATNSKAGDWQDAKLDPPRGMVDMSGSDAVEKYKEAKKEAHSHIKRGPLTQKG
tara:strand:- start:280 stop:1314 length:1035 start_codon:yes stop_codon:yes gene_type:complete